MKSAATRASAAAVAKSTPKPGRGGTALAQPGRPLDPRLRLEMEQRFGHDFSRVRVHVGAAAEQSAAACRADAYTVGHDIVFGARRFVPDTVDGRRLLAHELTHVVQQSTSAPRPEGGLASAPKSAEREADEAAARVMRGERPSVIRTSGPALARQANGADEDELHSIDVPGGTPVSKIVIDIRRGRVGFVVPAPKFVILGKVSTDLKPGIYSVSPEPSKQRWVFRAGQTKSGKRFDITLDEGSPWNLSYPEHLPVIVGMSAEKKGGPTGSTEDVDADADFVRTWDEATAEFGDLAADPSIDGLVDWTYEPSIVPGTNQFSNRVTLRYPDGSEESIDLSIIDETSDAEPDPAAPTGKTLGGRDLPAKLNCRTTPNLCSMKKSILRTQKLLLEKWDAELLAKELETFPQVFGTLLSVGIGTKGMEIRGRPRGGAAAPGGIGGKAAPAVATRIKPVNGVVNVGGGLEDGASAMSNLNPIIPNTGGPVRGIPNHIKAGFEQIAEVFEAGSVTKITSQKLPASTVNWTLSAQGAAKVMQPGGKVALNVWQLGDELSATIKAAFEQAGFKNVKVVGKGSTLVIATR